MGYPKALVLRQTHPMRSTNLSVIIPTNQLSEDLTACLRSLHAQTLVPEHEVIVVLDGIAKDPSFFTPFSEAIKIIELKENRGPAYARNEGARQASGNVLFFVDADVVLHPDTLHKVDAFFSRPDHTPALIGSYDDQPFHTATVSKFRNLLHHYTHQCSPSGVSTFWGACGAVTKEAFWHVGGFDTSFPKPSVEDIELGYRLLESGYKITLQKDIFVKHLKHWTFQNMLQTDIFYRAKPWTKLLIRHQKMKEKNLNINPEEKIAAILLFLSVLSLLAGLFSPLSFLFSLVLALSLITLKRRTYSFFAKHFSWLQMPIVALLHWCYLGSAVVGFALGTIEGRYIRR